MTINFQQETQEVLEINNIIYTIMPSDISMFSDNALTEEVYFRSKGAFAFRSKHSNSAVNITFPIPLLDPSSLESYSDQERELFNNGINLVAQLSGFPFCFVRSARIHSYLGVSFQTPNEYLMFGVHEVKIIQDARITGTLMVEVTLLLNNHTNLVSGLRFVSDYYIDQWKGLSVNKSVDNIQDSVIFTNFMTALTGDVLGNYMALLREIGVVDAQGNFALENSLTNLTIKAPYVAGEDQLKLTDNNSKLILDINEDQLSSIEYETFKMYDRFVNGDKTFDGSSLAEFQAKDIDELDFIHNKDDLLRNWRMFYLADSDLFNPAINAIQSVLLTRTNAFVPHHIGSSQHPYLQYLGKYPARMEIVSIYNSKGSYEMNEKSTMNLFQVLLNSVDTNNTLYPGANAYNYLKVKSVAGALLGIQNMMPGECTLSATAESSNTEVFSTSFVENSLNYLIDESKVAVGREIVSSQRQKAAIQSIFMYVNAVSNSVRNVELEKKFSYVDHIKVMKDLALLYSDITSELSGDTQNGDNVVVELESGKVPTKTSSQKFTDLANGRPNKDLFLKLLPFAYETVTQIDKRLKVNDFKMNKNDPDSKNKGVEGTVTINKDGKEEVKAINEVYNFNPRATATIEKLLNTINYMSANGIITLAESPNMQARTLEELNDQFLLHSFVGDSQKDINLDKYQPNVDFRKFLDPFFFIDATPIISQTDFIEAYDIIGTDAVDKIKEVVSREIGEGGVLEGSAGNSHELIAEMSQLKEKRYAARDAASDPNAVSEGNGQGSFGNGGVVDSNTPPAIAAAYAYSKSLASSSGRCAEYVRKALQKAGYSFTPNPSAYQYSTRGTLSQMGFGSIPTNTTYQVGDIVIINKTGPHPHGHICIFHTNGWVSDFRQRGWNVYGAGQTHSLWRDRRFLNGATASSGPISNSGGFGVSSGGAGGSTSGDVTSGSYIEKAFIHLRSRGFSAAAASAVIGNFRQESASNLDPNARNKSSGALGIGQWLGVRQRNMKAFLQKQGKSWNDINGQLDFFIHEITNDSYEKRAINIHSSYTWATFKTGTNVQSLTVAFRKGYERPGQHEANDARRIKYANEVMKSFGGKQVSTSTSATVKPVPPKGNNNGSPSTKSAEVGIREGEANLPRYYKPNKDFPKQKIGATVVKVVDGDSFIVKTKHYMDGKNFMVRLHEADAPETYKTNSDGTIKSPSQYWGPDAAALAKSMIEGKSINLTIRNIQDGNRVVADVEYSGKNSLAELMIKNGSAYYYAPTNNTLLRALQEKAKKEKIGMWKELNGDRTMDPSRFRANVPKDKKYWSDTQPKGEVVGDTNKNNQGAIADQNTVNSTGDREMQGGVSASDLSVEDINGYSLEDVIMDAEMSVFDESLQVIKHVEKMYTNFDKGLNISFPIIKAYAVVGNESDNLFTSEVPLQPAIYFELPTLNNLNVATNNDENPVDVCTFSMVNPSSTRSSSEFYGDSAFGSNVYNLDSQYYNLFYADRIKLKPGMKIHIKAGYSNSPGQLKTIFNGVIDQVSGTQDLLLQVTCYSFGAELLANSIGFEKPLDLSNGKNASTGLIIAYSMLQDTVSHFGSKASATKTWLAYASVATGTVVNDIRSLSNLLGYQIIANAINGTSAEPEMASDENTPNTLEAEGDFRDPEAKPLIAPLNFGDILGFFNPSRANLAQRMFTNIYSDAIEAAHNQYKSNLWSRVSLIFDFMDSKLFYKYFAFRSSTWSILKEMEYRHPGTLAKPLWYDERMTMFYGIKEQLYIAKDLTPMFMFQAGRAGLFKDINQPYTADYLLERHKRLEPATGFHLLSSKLNIIDNNLTLSRDFATRINVMYYESEYEGNRMMPESKSFVIDIDDNIAPFDIREETISLNGCHGKYMSWMYGIQELKKQTEQMYRGTITVTGKPDMRAGDYAYLEDADRGMSGVIKIRECTHHFSTENGYVTKITPGLHVECTQFYWSTLFTQLGMASKMALMKADISVNNLLTTNKVADSYYEYLKVIQNSQTKSLSNVIFGVGGTAIVSGLNMFFLWKMGSKSSALKNGMTKDQFNRYWKQSADLARDTKNYSKYVGKNLLETAAKKSVSGNQKIVAEMTKDGLKPKSGIPSKILQQIKNISSMKNLNVLKMASKVPWGALKGVLGVGSMITKGVLGALATNPLGWVITIVGTILFSVVMSKFKEIGLTHNPLIMFPINYNGKPYVAGISGYENNSIFEGAMTNIKRNINSYKKAAHALKVTSQGTSTAASMAETGMDLSAGFSTLVYDSATAVSNFISGSDGNAQY